MLTSILVASDLSIRSERALRRAFKLAEQHDASVTVVNVVDGDLPLPMTKNLVAQGHEELERLCRSISDKTPEIRVMTGHPVAEILAVLRSGTFDLLVLGSHRPRAFWDLFSGTTVERIVRASTIPALLVVDAVDHEYQTVLAGIDLSPCSAAAVNMAASLVPGKTIHTFHAYNVPFRGFTAPRNLASEIEPFRAEAKDELDRWWDTTTLPDTCEKPTPSDMGLGALLTMKMGRLKPDLLAVGAHGRPALAPTMLGSFTESLLRDPPCDVLVVRR